MIDNDSHLNSWIRENEGYCAQTVMMKMSGASASQPNLGFHWPILALIRLGLLHSGSFGVVHVLWEISSVYA